MAVPEDKRCLAIGRRSYRQCTQRRLAGKEFCRAHDKSPTLPESERTTLPELVYELEDCKKEVTQEPVSRHISQSDFDESPQDFVIICPNTSRQNFAKRCQAKSKRSGLRCRNAACKGKQVCRMHGASAGPKSTKNCGKHFFKHGCESREIRRLRSQKVAEFRILQRAIREWGL